MSTAIIYGLTFVFLINALLSLSFALIAARRHQMSGAQWLTVLLFALVLWSFGFLMELNEPNLSQKLLWGKVQMVSVATVPVLWLLLALHFTKQNYRTAKRSYELLAMVIPAVTILLAWTNEYHSLIWVPYPNLEPYPSLISFAFGRGHWAWLQAFYSYLAIFSGTLVFIRGINRVPYLYRGQAFILIIAALLPWLGNMLFLSRIYPLPYVDLTPIGFCVGAIPIVVGLYRLQILEVAPLARELVVEHMLDPVFVIDNVNHIVDSNIAAQNLLRRSATDLIARPLADFFPTLASLEQVGRIVPHPELHLDIPGVGSQSYEIDIVNPNLEHTFQGRVLVLHNITERKRAEHTIHQARAEAEAANRAKSDFLATMSHEIRTPLNAVLGLTELVLMDDNLRADQRESLEQVRSSGDGLVKLLSDLLDFSKIEAGRLHLEEIEFDLYELASHTIEMFAPRAINKALNIRYTIQPDVPRVVLGDPTRLRQVLYNFLGNAIKFTDVGSVELQIHRIETPGTVAEPNNDLWIEVAVSDTGIGIAPERQAAIFDPFTQADQTTSRLYGGTGLGLTICKQLVRLFGGELKLESQLGLGSTFTFTARLQHAPEQSTVTKSPTLAENEVVYKKLFVLVADDNPINRKVLQKMLTMRGWDVQTANNGQAAVALCAHYDFDIALMDIEMPELNGYQACQAIRFREQQTQKHLPIVALTAHALPENRLRAFDAGMDEFLTKPIKSTELYEMVEKLTGYTKNQQKISLAEPSKNNVFDVQDLLQRCGDDHELVSEILTIFRETAPEQLVLLEGAIKSLNFAEIEEHAHKLKGTASTLSAMALADVANQLQTAGQTADAALAQALLPDLQLTYQELMVALKDDSLAFPIASLP